MDWREVSVAEWRVALPCKPSVYERRVPLAGASLTMRLQACQAGGATWSVADLEVDDATRIAPALLALRDAARANLDGQVIDDRAWAPRGWTPAGDARRIVLSGRLPDGRETRQWIAMAAVGTRVVQLVVMGAAPVADDVEMFFESARVPP